MSNMSYCRFQNTLKDLHDCYDSLVGEDKTINDLSKDEARAFREMYELMQDFVDNIDSNDLLEEDGDGFASHNGDFGGDDSED